MKSFLNLIRDNKNRHYYKVLIDFAILLLRTEIASSRQAGILTPQVTIYIQIMYYYLNLHVAF